MTGKYHRPREEQKIFMFLDIKDSTPLAEQLGTLKFSALIQDFFADMSLPLRASRGQVSHYIGDEAVIVWQPEKGVKNSRCVRFFFEMASELAEHETRYRSRYGVVPGFKAGLHLGPVVAAEVGDDKSEIVYHGDTVNTTARVVGLCSALGNDLLLSKDMVQALGAEQGFDYVSAGVHQLKGKAEPMEVFTVKDRSV
jgi:adenylate cyclase